ncbi:MAG TPA: hypothetical protein VLH56_11455 [Dissulfurispiraceae bacterium]|nr:hypothetical protein [Dissulfurispiraceae bacterium]
MTKKTQLLVIITEDLHKRIKSHCALRGKPMGAFLTQAITDRLKKEKEIKAIGGKKDE